MTTTNQPLIPADFVLDEHGLRQALAELDEDDRPMLAPESPARSIDALVADYNGFIHSPTSAIAGVCVFPIIYEDDPDAVMIGVSGGYERPFLCGYSEDWDDYIDARVGEELTFNQVVDMFKAVVDEANRILARARA